MSRQTKIVVARPDRYADRCMIKLKPGDEKRYYYPTRENQWYQIAIAATFHNDKTGESKHFGYPMTGRYARTDVCTSRQSRKIKFDEMYDMAIRAGYLRVVPPPYVGDPYMDDDWWGDENWNLQKVHAVYLIIQRDVRYTKNGGKRKIKVIKKSELKEKKSYTKRLLAEKKKKVAKRMKKYETPKKTSTAWKKLQKKNRDIAKRAAKRKKR